MAKLQAASASLHAVSLALPHEMLICDCQQDIARAMRETDEQGKNIYFNLTLELLRTQDARAMEVGSQDTCKALNKCQDLTLSDASAASEVYKLVLDFMVDNFKSEQQYGGQRLLNIAEKLAPFLPEPDQRKDSLQSFSNFQSVYQLLADKVGMEDDKYSFCKDTVDFLVVKKFQAHLVKAKGFRDQSLKNASTVDLAIPTKMQQLVKDTLFECDGIESDAMKYYIAKQEERVSSATDAVRTLAGGVPGGHDWTDGLGLQCSWDVFLDAGKNTILKNEALAVPTVRKQLMQDLSHIHYLLKAISKGFSGACWEP